MALYTRSLLSALILGLCGVAWADDAKPSDAPVAESTVAADKQAPAANEPERVDVGTGTKIFDAATVGELFSELKAENEKRAAEEAPHMNPEDLEVIELAPLEVEPFDQYKFRILAEKIDPQPRRRLARLAELDPAAAADLQVTMRAEERFFAGEEDATYDANAGRVAEVDFRKASAAAVAAMQKASKSLKTKSVTDDQPTAPTAPESAQ